MKVFLDECIDWHLARLMQKHDVKTARQMGWTGKKNGRLLALATTQFDAFVTVDQNLRFQQNLSEFQIAIYILRAKTNRLADFEPLVPELLVALEMDMRGKIYTVSG